MHRGDFPWVTRMWVFPLRLNVVPNFWGTWRIIRRFAWQSSELYFNTIQTRYGHAENACVEYFVSLKRTTLYIKAVFSSTHVILNFRPYIIYVTYFVGYLYIISYALVYNSSMWKRCIWCKTNCSVCSTSSDKEGYVGGWFRLSVKGQDIVFASILHVYLYVCTII